MASVIRGSGESTLGGALDVQGVLTYEDVTSVDAVGIITAQAGVDISNTIVPNNDSTIRYDDTDFVINVDPNNVRGSSKFKINVDTVNAVTIDDNRRIGIGTNNPDELLEVGNGTAVGGLKVSGQSTGITDEGLTFDWVSSGSAARFFSESAGDSIIQFYTTSSGTRGERLRITSDGKIGIGTDNPQAQFDMLHGAIRLSRTASYTSHVEFGITHAGASDYGSLYFDNSNATGDYVFRTTSSNSEKLRITSDGRVLLGIQTPRAGVFNTNLITPFFQMESAGQVDHNRMMTLVSNPGSTGGYEPVFIFGKSRGTSAGDFGAVGNNDGLGIISFQGADGAELVEAARISAAVDGAVNTANDMPGRLDFWVTKDGASAPVNPTMRIHNTGYMNVGGYIDSNDINRLNGINSLQGTHIATISGYQSTGGSTQDTMLFNAVNASGSANASGCAVKVYRNDTTLRSINAAGTVNTSGNDYAEYMVKAGDFTIAKGDICGVNAQGKLTNVFADAVTFVVKSTDPSYVGGDTWDTAAGEEPGGYDDTRTGEELEAAKVAYQEQLEIVRQTVDRIAFSGQTPVNVTGSTPGQHIIPTANSDGSISGTAKSEGDLTLAEYMSSVGKVIAIEEDGRAKIIVKVS
tara:strand:- start:91 stop:1992 length:1902 start_codon:yes stop_codon:yes gene_type:complete